MKKIFFFVFSFALCQNIYNGQINFDYIGTENGYFNSLIEDSLKTGILINQENNDSSLIIMTSFMEREDSNYDIFFSILQDTIFPVQERFWEIPGEGNENNPLSLEALTLFIPAIDSSFAIEIFNVLNDSSNSNDSNNLTEYLETIFIELSDYLYIGLSGEINFYAVTDSTIAGEFNIIMIKPTFNFPPHMITIENGSITFNKTNLQSLNIKKHDIIPTSIKLYNCYPNPFNPETNINFFTTNQNIFIGIYDINGKLIKTFYSGFKNKGFYSLKWNANQYSSGVYFVKLISKESIQTKKLLFIK